MKLAAFCIRINAFRKYIHIYTYISKGNYKAHRKQEYELILFSFPLSIVLLAVRGILLIIQKNWNITVCIINKMG